MKCRLHWGLKRGVRGWTDPVRRIPFAGPGRYFCCAWENHLTALPPARHSSARRPPTHRAGQSSLAAAATVAAWGVRVEAALVGCAQTQRSWEQQGAFSRDSKSCGQHVRTLDLLPEISTAYSVLTTFLRSLASLASH